jgi:hypothetical protein
MPRLPLNNSRRLSWYQIGRPLSRDGVHWGKRTIALVIRRGRGRLLGLLVCCGYPAFCRAPGFCSCFSGAAFAGAPPAIGNKISRWLGVRLAAGLPLGAAASFAGVCLAPASML